MNVTAVPWTTGFLELVRPKVPGVPVPAAVWMKAAEAVAA